MHKDVSCVCEEGGNMGCVEGGEMRARELESKHII
jgi:hypothetical protein